MPYRKVAAKMLAEWRAADRLMARLEPGSAAWEYACLLAELAKAHYQDAIEAARAEHLPEPPPFEEARRKLTDP